MSDPNDTYLSNLIDSFSSLRLKWRLFSDTPLTHPWGLNDSILAVDGLKTSAISAFFEHE
jgi:hypothetical protein